MTTVWTLWKDQELESYLDLCMPEELDDEYQNKANDDDADDQGCFVIEDFLKSRVPDISGFLYCSIKSRQFLSSEYFPWFLISVLIRGRSGCELGMPQTYPEQGGLTNTGS